MRAASTLDGSGLEPWSLSYRIVKRCFDLLVAALALILTSPILLGAALGIRLTSAGPIFYRARRAGLNGRPFAMLKFRTMHVGADRAGPITAPGDARVFRFGGLLRRLKIDELPQFWNILIGDMSVVGPRPEDPGIVDRDYTPWMRETLLVRPGVTSPGAIYGYVYGDALLDAENVETAYVDMLLRPKLALERAYLERANFWSDCYYMVLTALAIVASVGGRTVSLPSKDTERAQKWAPEAPYP